MSDPNQPSIPEQDTPAYFDYLLNALVEETLLHVYIGDNTDSISFHMGMLRAAYQRALERKEERSGDER